MDTEFWDYQQHVAYDRAQANKVQLATTPQTRTSLWCLLPGQNIPAHDHAGDHVWIVLEGEGTFLGDDGPRRVTPGTVLLAPQGREHGIENSGSAGLVFLSLSTG